MFGFISEKLTACNTFSLKIGEFGKKNWLPFSCGF